MAGGSFQLREYPGETCAYPAKNAGELANIKNGI
jgi:hypothetical protein